MKGYQPLVLDCCIILPIWPMITRDIEKTVSQPWSCWYVPDMCVTTKPLFSCILCDCSNKSGFKYARATNAGRFKTVNSHKYKRKRQIKFRLENEEYPDPREAALPTRY